MDRLLGRSLLLLLGLISTCHAENTSNDNGVVFTALARSREGYRHVVAFDESLLDTEYNGIGNGFVHGDLGVSYLACDVDYDKQYLYLFDYEEKRLTLAQNFSIKADKSNMNITVQHYGLPQEYIKLAVDWVSHNIYWADTLMGWIVMQPGGPINNNARYRIIASKHVDQPRAIAVDPIAGYLFWSDMGVPTRIERSSLTGERRLTLVNHNIESPLAITADPATRRIYWVDVTNIDSVEYSGINRRHIKRYSYAIFFDLALFEGVVIVTDIGESAVFYYNQTTGAPVRRKTGSTTEIFLGTCAYNQASQPIPTAPERCQDAGCQDICINEPTNAVDEPTNFAARCLCRSGFELGADGKSCIEAGGQHYRAIVINNGTHLCLLDIRILTDHHDYQPKYFYKAETGEVMTIMDLNMDQRVVYFAVDTKIFRVSVDGTTNANIREELVNAPAAITGLSYDWINDHIYYTTAAVDAANPGYIWVLSPTTKKIVEEKIPTGEKPMHVAVVPHENRVFWIANQNIEYANMSALETSVQQMNLTYGLYSPSHLYHDVKKEELYLMDDYTNYKEIMRVNYNGTEAKYREMNPTALDMAVYKNYILFAVVNGEGKTELTSLDTTTFSSKPYAEGTIKGIDTVKNIRILDKDALQPTYVSPCGKSTKKGGCQHICLPINDTSAVCKCETGFIIGPNGKNCTSEPVTDNFLLIGDITHDAVYQIPLNRPDVLIGFKTPGLTGEPSAVKYNFLTNEILVSSRSEGSIFGYKMDGSIDYFTINTWHLWVVPSSMAVDPSTGNIFYTGVSYFSEFYYDSHIGVIGRNKSMSVVVKEGDQLMSLALHPERGLMFWTDYSTDKPGIFRAQMDGANKIIIVKDDITWPNGLVIDYDVERLYWTDGHLDKIYYCGYDGSGRVEFISAPNSHLMGLAMMGDFLYYSAWDLTQIIRVNKNDKTEVKLGPTSTLGRINTVDVYSSTLRDVIPVSVRCQTDNGDCSQFCYPTPSGRTCGCESPYILLGDGRTCENDPRCPGKLPNGVINDAATTDCLRLPGNKCEFSCDMYYRPKSGVTILECMTDPNGTDHYWDNADPCEEIVCPATIENADLASTCNRSVGDDCSFTCSTGYEPLANATSLKCTTNGTWDYPSPCAPRCRAVTSTTDHASLDTTCLRKPTETCNMHCDDGYRFKSSVKSITCQTGSQWDTPPENICEEILCPTQVNNAFLTSSCSYKVGQDCHFVCADGHESVMSRVYINCTEGGTWDFLEPCQPRCRPLTASDHASVDSTCPRSPGKSCRVQCEDKYRYANVRTNITCQTGSAWDVSPATVCEQTRCPDFIPDGLVNASCSRLIDAECSFNCDSGFGLKEAAISTVVCKTNGQWNSDQLCIGISVAQAGASNAAAIGAGVGGGILVLIIIVVILIFLVRKGMLPVGKSSSGSSSGTSFENPRYASNDVNLQSAGTEANRDFTYATLEEDTVDYETWQKGAQTPASAVNPGHSVQQS